MQAVITCLTPPPSPQLSVVQGESAALQQAMSALTDCLERPDGCRVVPGLPIEQYYATLTCSIAGGLVAGFVSKIEPQGGWKTACKRGGGYDACTGQNVNSAVAALGMLQTHHPGLRRSCWGRVAPARLKHHIVLLPHPAAAVAAVSLPLCRHCAAAMGVAAAVLSFMGQPVCQLWPGTNRFTYSRHVANCSQHSSFLGSGIPTTGAAAAVGWGQCGTATCDKQ